MLQQGFFKIYRIDVEPSGDDHVLAAVEDVDKPVFIDPAHIATAIEHQALRAGPEHLPGLFRTVEVAAHHGDGPADNFPDFAPGQLPSLVVDHPHLGPLGGQAHGSPFAGVGGTIQAGGDAALGQAVHLPDIARPPLHGFGDHIRPQGRTGAQLELETGQVEAVEIRNCQDALVLHRYQHGVGHPVLLGQFQEPVGIEFCHQYQGAAVEQGR